MAFRKPISILAFRFFPLLPSSFRKIRTFPALRHLSKAKMNPSHQDVPVVVQQQAAANPPPQQPQPLPRRSLYRNAADEPPSVEQVLEDAVQYKHDITFVAGAAGEHITAISSFVICKSNKLRLLLEAQPTPPAGERKVILVPDHKPSAIMQMLRWMMVGGDQLPETEVREIVPLVWTAAQFGIEELTRLAYNKLQQSLAINNALLLFQQAFDLKMRATKELVQGFINQHASDCLRSLELIPMSRSALIEVLRSDELDVDQELDVYKAILRWVNAKIEARTPSKKLRRKVAGARLLYAIRVRSMESAQVCNGLNKTFLSRMQAFQTTMVVNKAGKFRIGFDKGERTTPKICYLTCSAYLRDSAATTGGANHCFIRMVIRGDTAPNLWSLVQVLLQGGPKPHEVVLRVQEGVLTGALAFAEDVVAWEHQGHQATGEEAIRDNASLMFGKGIVALQIQPFVVQGQPRKRYNIVIGMNDLSLMPRNCQTFGMLTFGMEALEAFTAATRVCAYGLTTTFKVVLALGEDEGMEEEDSDSDADESMDD